MQNIFSLAIYASIFFRIWCSTQLFAIESTSALNAFRQEFIQLVKDVEKSAVSIEAHMGVGQHQGSEPAIEMINSGAGIILGSNHIIAKQKIVNGSDHITIRFHDQTEANGTVVGSDDDLGLSVLRVEKSISDDFQPQILADPRGIAPGEPVLILSNSLGIMPAVSFGIVNCTRSDGMIQLSADLPAGASSGAVFNFSGQLIGLVAVEINFFPDELPYSSDLLANETVLVNPIRDIIAVKNGILKLANKKSVYFGVSVDTWPSQMGGAHIKQVIEGSPAAQSGMKTGDIVLSTDSRKVATAADLFQIISSHSAGDIVSMQILRGDQIFPINVTLASTPRNTLSESSISSESFSPNEQQIKITNDYLHKRLKKLEMDMKILKEMIENN
ncbi:serine protease [candidate division KSB1 bacterium]|nr:serine protease [candidate division KSB1 bacterium]